ncbi:MAG: hypothetical protein KF842_04025 [Caulobacter sp.]|nr:hypothetical protein [Caulobacter sp.]
MRISSLTLCAVAAAALLAGCNRKEEAPPAPAPAPPVETAPAAPEPEAVAAPVTGFHHSGNFDAAGYYMPTQPVRVGAWELQQMGVGAVSDFAAWEQGDRTSTFGPIVLEFADTSSPVQTNELGNETHAIRARILPSGYSMDGKTLRFAGRDPKLGEVTFEGTLDTAAMASAKAQGASEQPVLTGVLRVGDVTYANTKFSFYAGD